MIPCQAVAVRCIVFSPVRLLREKKGRRKSRRCENSALCYWCKAAFDNSASKWTAEQKTDKMLIFSYLDSSQRVDEANDPRPSLLHRSLFAAPDQSITFGNLRFPAAIASCRILLFWQCLREEHCVRCQVKTICDRFGGEIKRRQTGS